jgi:hypothetical protein
MNFSKRISAVEFVQLLIPFYTAQIYSISMDGRMIVNDKLEKICQKVEGQGVFKTPFQNLLRLIEENTDISD